MRLHFREKPLDLYTVIVYTVVMASVLLIFSVGNLLAVLLVLFVPGYIVVAAIFPGDAEIDFVERIALSFGLSIAIVPLLGLLLNFTPWGIRFAPVIATITIFTLCAGYLAYRRRMRLKPEQRLSATLDLTMAGWNEYTSLDKSLTIALAASIVVAAGTLGFVVLTPRPGESLTEFFILGPGGNASGYPTSLNVSQPGTVILGIVNHDAATVNYPVRVDLVGVEVLYNATSGFNETIELNRTTWSYFNVTLVQGADWMHPYTFSVPYVSLWKVQFLLFRGGDFSKAYRELHLYVRVH